MILHNRNITRQISNLPFRDKDLPSSSLVSASEAVTSVLSASSKDKEATSWSLYLEECNNLLLFLFSFLMLLVFFFESPGVAEEEVMEDADIEEAADEVYVELVEEYFRGEVGGENLGSEEGDEEAPEVSCEERDSGLGLFSESAAFLGAAGLTGLS